MPAKKKSTPKKKNSFVELLWEIDGMSWWTCVLDRNELGYRCRPIQISYLFFILLIRQIYEASGHPEYRATPFTSSNNLGFF